jgi:hypothetical protein
MALALHTLFGEVVLAHVVRSPAPGLPDTPKVYQMRDMEAPNACSHGCCGCALAVLSAELAIKC